MAEKTESRKAVIVIGAFGDAGKCKELVSKLKRQSLTERSSLNRAASLMW